MKKFVFLSLLAATLVAPVAFNANAEDKAAQASTVELKDGTTVKVEGESVFVVGKDGKATPAPDGVHETKAGEKITTKGGKIVKSAE